MPVFDEAKRLELITLNQRPLYGFIFSLVGSRTQADEILQQTNLVLCRKIHEFAGRAKFITWACKIAKIEILAYRKRTASEKLVFVDNTLLEDVATAATEAAGESQGRLLYLRQCLDELPPRSRELIDRRYQPGASIRALAESLGRSAGGLRVSLHRVRAALLDCMRRKATMEGKP